ncbi:ribosome silencing factor [Persicobacter psychrovividus]|uniref:Ribosomal silencing factor RsfS n=1 Tax=Persicobacter psychrovividus TaxID=387638 RepID=A0ABN6L4P9_9BACT|nr:ribosomal silencing factor RsfS [Persicobacter psychrovividus]
MEEKNNLTSEELSQMVVMGMLDKKASNVVVMDLRKVGNAVADFFVVATGNSDTQVESIARGVDEEVFKQCKTNPWHREGMDNREWVLIDYVDVVVHVFKQDKREFYNLENMWGDAKITRIEE